MTITLFADQIAPARKNFPESFYDRMVNAIGILAPRARVLDIGTTIGEVARGFARFGAQVTALDRDDRLFAEARQLDAKAGVSVTYATGTAAATGQADAAFDLVFFGGTWPAVGAEAAAREAARVLKPGARLAIAAFEWQPLPRNVVEASEEIIARQAPAWPKGAINKQYSVWWPVVHAAGFRDFRTFFHDNDYAYSHAEFRAYVAARVKGVIAGDRLAALDGELDQMLKKRFPGDYVIAPHRSFVFTAERR